jgi:hypothetical protein
VEEGVELLLLELLSSLDELELTLELDELSVELTLLELELTVLDELLLELVPGSLPIGGTNV